MDRLKSILIGIDFSPCSAAALKQGLRLATWNQARVAAVHVVQIPVYALPPDPFLPVLMPPVDLLLKDAYERWGAWAPAREAGAGLRFDAIFGMPRSDLPERVRQGAFDLLVLGTHGDFDAKRGVGATAAACVQRAPSRVLLVREKQTGPFRSVVACIDFTDTSRLAMEQAVRIAAQDGAALHILHIFEDPWPRLGSSEVVRANMPDAPERYRQAVEDRMRLFCEPLAHELGALKAAYVARPFESHGEGILDFIHRQQTDLVVLGTRARWNVRDFLWGSTAERVVREAPCAVLTVKPPGFEQA